jgi:hypothetical protein
MSSTGMTTTNIYFEIKEVDLNTCKKGDILISKQGVKLKYVKPLDSNILYYDHEVAYLNKRKGRGTRTNDGHVFRHNRMDSDEDIVKIIPMSWVNIEKELPDYYSVVSIKLKDGKKVDAWRASDGDNNIYTIYGTDIVLSNDNIVKWRPNPKYF